MHCLNVSELVRLYLGERAESPHPASDPKNCKAERFNKQPKRSQHEVEENCRACDKFNRNKKSRSRRTRRGGARARAVMGEGGSPSAGVSFTASLAPRSSPLGKIRGCGLRKWGPSTLKVQANPRMISQMLYCCASLFQLQYAAMLQICASTGESARETCGQKC